MLCGTAKARESFLPGQVRSQALAEWVWRPECAHVGVSPFTFAETATLQRGVLGEAVGACTIKLVNDPALWADRRVAEIHDCTIIVHEYGHLAGYYDPVGFTNPDGTIDHEHSSDPHNVMYPTLEYTFPPCRDLFPRRAPVARPPARRTHGG